MKKKELRAENPDPVDIHVGSRLRLRRNLIGLSQEYLGKSLGLTFQQIQKYERGINRVGASRLFQIATALGCSVSYFFEGIPQPVASNTQGGFAESGQSALEGAPSVAKEDADILNRRETLELVRSYYRIKDPKQRRIVYDLARSMAEGK